MVEDEYTNRDCPFAAGATLASLNFQTTDEHWVPTILKEAVKLIHKVPDLLSFSLLTRHFLRRWIWTRSPFTGTPPTSSSPI